MSLGFIFIIKLFLKMNLFYEVVFLWNIILNYIFINVISFFELYI